MITPIITRQPLWSSGGGDGADHTIGPHENTGVMIIPEPASIVYMNFNPFIPGKIIDTDLGAKEKINGTLDLYVNGAWYKTYAEVSIQGSGSAAAAVRLKNWTFKFLDAATVDSKGGKQQIKLGDSPTFTRLMLKSSWSDPTKIRDPLSNTIWRQMVESRDNPYLYEPDVKWLMYENAYDGGSTPAKGFPDWWQTAFYVEGRLYSIGNLALTKEPENYNMAEDDQESLDTIFRVESRGWAEAYVDGVIGEGVDFIVPDSEWDVDRKKSMTDFLEFVQSDKDDFKLNFDTFLDEDNAIRYHLFLSFVGDRDGTNEMMVVSYDQQKWYFLPWDKDSTFGNYGSTYGGIDTRPDGVVVESQSFTNSMLMPWTRILYSKRAEVEAMYAYFRNEGIFSVRNIRSLVYKLRSFYPESLVKEDYDKIKDINVDTYAESSTTQLIDWVTKRLAYLDAYYNYTP